MRTKRPKTPLAEFTELWLNDACMEWQTRLRLLDWCVTVRFARGYELGPADADCDPTLTLKRATIRVVCPGDYNGRDPYDPETYLCHELLHLHFAPFAVTDSDWNTPAGIAMEQAIDLIACGLVKAKRGQ